MNNDISLAREQTQPRNDEHSFQDGWKWSANLAQFIGEHVRGHSLAVGTGKCPIGTVNLDIANIGDFAAQDNADFKVIDIAEDDALANSIRRAITDGSKDRLYGRIKPDPPVGVEDEAYELFDGYAFQGDMFDIPFRNHFDTTVLDPPWKDLTLTERETIILEAKKATKMGGNIILNATWSPKQPSPDCIAYDERFRQQEDAKGGNSIITFYEIIPEEIATLLEHHIEDSSELESTLPYQFTSPNAIDTEYNTDPRFPSVSHQAYCCPLCGCSRLEQKRDKSVTNNNRTSSTYKCMGCGFPNAHVSVKKLADKLKEKAERRGVDITDIEYLAYTPDVVKQHIKDPVYSEPNSSLPWVPNLSENDASTETITDSKHDEPQEDTLPANRVNQDLYAQVSSIEAD